MRFASDSVGMSKRELDQLFEREMEKNADLLVGIDDPEVLEMISVLKKAVIAAIIANNEKIEDDINELFRDKLGRI